MVIGGKFSQRELLCCLNISPFKGGNVFAIVFEKERPPANVFAGGFTYLIKPKEMYDNSLKVNIASICMFFAIFCRGHQTIFFEDFTKIIYVAISNKLGNFYERIVGI